MFADLRLLTQMKALLANNPDLKKALKELRPIFDKRRRTRRAFTDLVVKFVRDQKKEMGMK